MSDEKNIFNNNEEKQQTPNTGFDSMNPFGLPRPDGAPEMSFTRQPDEQKPENSEEYSQTIQSESIPQQSAQMPNAQYIPVYTPPTSTSAELHKKPKKSSSVKGFFIGVASTAVILAGIFGCVKLASFINKTPVDTSDPKPSGSNSSIAEIQESPSTDISLPSGSDTVLTPAQIAAKVRKSIVSIIAYDTSTFGSSESQGSGIILSSDGYIVTNSHVIGDTNTNRVTVIVYSDENESGVEYEAAVLGYDTKTDIAVLKITAENLTPAEIGESSKLVSGDSVVAIGNPGGVQFAGSITVGYVSGINRVIDGDGTSTSAMKYIQTDAAINPGNSGGALVNVFGQVIGINTAKISDEAYEGMGFAIPFETALPIIEDLKQYGYVKGRVKLGITVYEISETTARYYNVPAGIMIYTIENDSSLVGKVSAGDIITAVDGIKIDSLTDLQDIIVDKNPGDVVKLSVYRGATRFSAASEFTAEVTLAEDRGTASANQSEQENSSSNNSQNPFYEEFWNDLF